MFSEEEKHRIVEEYKKGKVMTEVAEEFDCTAAYVSMLVRKQGVSKVQKKEKNIEKEKENYVDSNKSDYEFAMYLRDKYGWGPKGLSKVIGVSWPTIGHWIYEGQKPGNTATITDEMKEKLSERMKENNPMENEETVKKMRQSLKEFYEENGSPVKGRTHSEEALEKMRNKSEETLEKIGRAKRGENNPNWKGGVSEEYGYYGPNWREIREEILDKNNYTCQICGRGDGKNARGHSVLCVHHIIPFYKFDSREEANRRENLITLCESCHRKVDVGKIELEVVNNV